MAEDWLGIAKEVDAALASVGQVVQLVRKGTRGGTEAEPTFGPESLFDLNVLDDMTRTDKTSGTLIKNISRILIVSAVGAIPTEKDMIQSGSNRFTIVAVLPLSPAGVDLLYEIEIEA
jgi:hypothetical protein